MRFIVAIPSCLGLGFGVRVRRDQVFGAAIRSFLESYWASMKSATVFLSASTSTTASAESSPSWCISCVLAYSACAGLGLGLGLGVGVGVGLGLGLGSGLSLQLGVELDGKLLAERGGRVLHLAHEEVDARLVRGRG